MRASDLIAGKISTLCLKRKDNLPFDAIPASGQDMELLADINTDQYWINYNGESVIIQGNSKADNRKLDSIFESDGRNFSWLVGTQEEKGRTFRLQIQNHQFLNRLVLPEQLRIGVDEKIYESFGKNFIQGQIPDSAKLDKIRNLFLLKSGIGKVTRLQVIPPSSEASLNNSSFAIVGKNARAIVKSSDEDGLYIERIHRYNGVKDKLLPSLTIIEADLDFIDGTEAGKFVQQNKHLMDSMEASGNSWVNLWKQYNNLEISQVRKQASSLGWYAYTECEHSTEGWIFRLDVKSSTMDLIDNIPAKLQLEAGNTVPRDITNSGVNDNLEKNTKQKHSAFIANFKEYDPIGDYIILEQSDERDSFPPETGYIYVSLIGSQVRHKRRVDALEAVQGSTAPMIQLRYILDNLPFPTIKKATSIPALKADIKKKVFNGAPTSSQARAIKMALNSSDITLIQGPPGTGKTRVIAAIINQLLYEAERREDIDGNILVCSEQHDAVANVASVSKVYDIPTPIVGGKDERNNYGLSPHIDRWRLGKKREIEDRRNDLPASEIEELRQKIHLIAASYYKTPATLKEVVALLDDLIETTNNFLSIGIQSKLYSVRSKYQNGNLSGTNDDDHELCLKAIRSIRTTKESFEDDGPYTLQKALRRIDRLNLVSASQSEKINAIFSSETTTLSKVNLEALEEFKNAMIDLIQEKSTKIRTSNPFPEMPKLLAEVSSAILNISKGVSGGPAGVLLRYQDDLENDPFGVKETLQNYAFVLASTAQQAGSRRMIEAKAGDVRSGIEFDTVIIDEAARANPLDLLIPMSLAKKRIILVGDHKQLPHIVDPVIENDLSSAIEMEKDPGYALRVSLFERLFHRLEEVHETGGGARTVTLDTQFRMHPVIGEFVSKHFYKNKLSSGDLPHEHFAHGIEEYRGTHISWLHVPYSAGREHDGKSKKRPAEAEELAEEVSRICVENPELSIGIISFYKAQVNEIFRALSETSTPLTEYDQEKMKIKDSFRSLPNDSQKERLRIGTVDAFQGMEFDVVFLSITRSNNIPLAEDKSSWARKYGFITIQSRLCVACSRAKKLLIIVGDKKMFTINGAEDAIPSLAELSRITPV